MKKKTNVKNANKRITPRKIKCNKTKKQITSSFNPSIQNSKLQTKNPNENLNLKTPNPKIGTEIKFSQRNIFDSGYLNC
jgi:hypothetical protein